MRPKADDPSRLRKRAVLICIATTLVIASAETFIGWRFNLISIATEGLHTFADLADSILALVLVLAATQPADQKHPYGHGKFDTLVGIVEGVFVGGSGIWAIVNATQVLMGLEEANPLPNWPAVLAMVIASVVYLFVSRYVFRLAHQTRSPAVYAEAMHLRTHIYITIGLVVGLLLTRWAQSYAWTNAGNIDSLVAMALGVYLLTVAFRVIRPAFRQMMDTSLSREEVHEISRCLNEFRDEFVEVHAVRTRRAGTDRHVDIHLMVPAETTVEKAHNLAHRIEDRLEENFTDVRLLVHLEPAVGQAWQAYLERNRVGVVIDGQSGFRKEDTHHRSRHAHRT